MVRRSVRSGRGAGSGSRTLQNRKRDCGSPVSKAESKKQKRAVQAKGQKSIKITAGHVTELKGMLERLAIKDNNDVFATTEEAKVTNGDVYIVASSDGKWLTDSVLRYVTQHLQSRFDPKGEHILLMSPSECQWISSVGQQNDIEITNLDRSGYRGRRYLFLVVNDAELGALGGSHWSLLVIDNETGRASHFNSLPSFKPQEDAAKRALAGIGRILERRYILREEHQTPHQTKDNLAKTDSRACGPFVLFMMEHLLESIVESDGRLKPKLQHQAWLPSDTRFTFDSMFERVKIMRLLVSDRAKLQQDKQDRTDEGGTGRPHAHGSGQNPTSDFLQNSDGRNSNGKGCKASVTLLNGNEDETTDELESDLEYDIDLKCSIDMDGEPAHHGKDYMRDRSDYGHNNAGASGRGPHGVTEDNTECNPEAGYSSGSFWDSDDETTSGSEADGPTTNRPKPMFSDRNPAVTEISSGNMARCGADTLTSVSEDRQQKSHSAFKVAGADLTCNDAMPNCQIMAENDDDPAAELLCPLDQDHYVATLANFLKTYGIQTVKDDILRAFTDDIRQLLDHSCVTLENLKALPEWNWKSCHSAGLYMHILYDPKNGEICGVYIGTSVKLSKRIRRYHQMKEDPITYNRGTGSTHYKFWTQEGIQDFWVLLGTIESIPFQRSEDQRAMLLNILEFYATALFSSIDQETLHDYLPTQDSATLYKWEPLNKNNPLLQYRRVGVEGHVRVIPSSGIPRTKHFFGQPNSLRTKWFKTAPVRKPDTSRGDKLQMEVLCATCRDPRTRLTHTKPRYAEDGHYVRRFFFCDSCYQYTYFRPVDPSMKSRIFNLVIRAAMQQLAMTGDQKAQGFMQREYDRKSKERRMQINDYEGHEERRAYARAYHQAHRSKESKARKVYYYAKAAEKKALLENCTYETAFKSVMEAKAAKDEHNEQRRQQVEDRSRSEKTPQAQGKPFVSQARRVREYNEPPQILRGAPKKKKAERMSKLRDAAKTRGEEDEQSADLAEIVHGRDRYRQRTRLQTVRYIERQQPLQVDNIVLSEMALADPEGLMALAEWSKVVVDRQTYKQWLLQIRDINLLCILHRIDLISWLRSMGADWFGKPLMGWLLQEAESILRAAGVDKSKWCLKEASKKLQQM